MFSAFDDPDGTYHVLINGDGQYSLWLADLDRPAGWTVVFGPSDRSSCLVHVTEQWTDLRPTGLRGHNL